MKKLLFLLTLFFSLIASSQVQNFTGTAEEKIKYEQKIFYEFDLKVFQSIYDNDIWLSEQISQLNSNYNFALNRLNELNDEIEALGSASNTDTIPVVAVDSTIYNRLDFLEAENKIVKDSLGTLAMQNSIQSDALWKLIYEAKSDSIAISILQNRVNNLNTFIQDEINIICENCQTPQQDSNLIELDSVSYANEGFSRIGRNEFFYDATLGDFAYITFEFKETIGIGDRVVISFDAVPTGVDDARLSIWMYYDGDDPNAVNVQDPRILGEELYDGENLSLEHTIYGVDRKRIAFRARNKFGGGSFYLKNVKVERLN